MIVTKNSNFLLFLTLVFSLLQISCFFNYEKIELQRAQTFEKSGKFDKSVNHYNRVIKRNPESHEALVSARSAARICQLELKDYLKAIQFLRHIIMYSDDDSERNRVQKELANIFFEKLENYDQAIVEYENLLKLTPKDSERYFLKSRIAKSHFQVNNFYQSLVEVESLIEETKDKESIFDLNLFKANIFLTTKKIDSAIKILKQLLKQNPEKAAKENVGINLSLAYEENKDFVKAMKTLEFIKESYPTKEFIELKINRLKQRAKNQPGARGLRK